MRLGKDGKVELIRHVPLFSKLSKSGLQEVASIADEIDLPEGKELTREGQPGREFFVILEGSAEVTQDGKRIRTMGEGDFLGEIALWIVMVFALGSGIDYFLKFSRSVLRPPRH